MERESFESEEIGAILKEHFVSIKVDREERPDVDKVYMTFIQVRGKAKNMVLCVFRISKAPNLLSGILLVHV